MLHNTFVLCVFLRSPRVLVVLYICEYVWHVHIFAIFMYLHVCYAIMSVNRSQTYCFILTNCLIIYCFLLFHLEHEFVIRSRTPPAAITSNNWSMRLLNKLWIVSFINYLINCVDTRLDMSCVQILQS